MNKNKRILAVLLIASPRYITGAHLQHAVGSWMLIYNKLQDLVDQGLVVKAKIHGNHTPLVGYTLTSAGAQYARQQLFEGVKLW